MIIHLYQNLSSPVALDKTLTPYAEFTGTLRGDCSVIDPVITVEIPQETLNITLLNYAFIPDFNRYYFINSMRVLRKGLWEISMHVDVLRTYAGHIRALPALVARNADGNLLLPDDEIDMYADSIVSTVQFPSALPAPTFILAMIGKDDDPQ